MKFTNITVVKNKNSPFEKKIISNFSCEIKKNNVNLIVGDSGSGKTTLVEGMIGLEPIEGEAYKFQEGKLSYVGQFPEKQIFEPNICDEINYFSKNYFRKEYSKDEIIKTLKKFNFKKDLLDHNAMTLSGGEKRKVALASAFISNPEIIVMDEPTVGLDGPSKLNFKKILKNEKRTYIIISHDLEFFEEFKPNIIKIKNGKNI